MCYVLICVSHLTLAMNVLQKSRCCLLLPLNGDLFSYYKIQGEGHVLQFTVLNSWAMVLGEICERWALDVSRVIVKFVTSDGHKMICPIESEANF